MKAILKSLKVQILAFALLGLLIPGFASAQSRTEGLLNGTIVGRLEGITEISPNANIAMEPVKMANREAPGAISITGEAAESIPEVVVETTAEDEGSSIVAGAPLAALLSVGVLILILGGVSLF